MSKYDRTLSKEREYTNLYPTQTNDRLGEIKSRLNTIKVGHITTMHDMVVYRSDEDQYIVGETINYSNSPRLDINEAAARIGIAACLPIQ